MNFNKHQKISLFLAIISTIFAFLTSIAPSVHKLFNVYILIDPYMLVPNRNYATAVLVSNVLGFTLLITAFTFLIDFARSTNVPD